MKIEEIKSGMSNINLKAKVVDVGEIRSVQTRFGKRSVADVTLEDDSGRIILTLWEEKINSVSVGDTVHISGAFASQFRDKIQLNIPRTGKMDVE